MLRNVALVTVESLEALFRQWHTTYCIKKKKGHQDILRSFEIYVFPTFGGIPVQDITLQMWLKLLEAIAEDVRGIADRILTNTWKRSLRGGFRAGAKPTTALV